MRQSSDSVAKLQNCNQKILSWFEKKTSGLVTIFFRDTQIFQKLPYWMFTAIFQFIYITDVVPAILNAIHFDNEGLYDVFTIFVSK